MNSNNHNPPGRRGRGRGFYFHPRKRSFGNSQPINEQNPVEFGKKVDENVNVVITDNQSNCPFPGWSLYFPLEDYVDNSPVGNRVKAFVNYLMSLNLDLDNIECKSHSVIDYTDLSSSEIIRPAIRDFQSEFQTNPQQIITELSLAMHKVVYEHKQDESITKSMSSFITVRLTGHGPVNTVFDLRAAQIGQFVSIRGNVVRVGQVKPVCIRMKFRCVTCKNEQVVLLPDGYKFSAPARCISRICKSKTFEPLKDSNETVTIDYQVIRLQEAGSDCPIPFSSNNDSVKSDSKMSEGRIPRTLNCVLVRDLVDCCMPGDEVVVSGCVMAESAAAGSFQPHSAARSSCLFNLVLHGNSVRRMRGDDKWDADERTERNNSYDTEFSKRDLYAIDAIHSEPNLFRLLVSSLCPSIYGHELVKASMLLSLFGGVTKFGNDKNRIAIRGNSHVLIVGDPGLGKSQMLQSACAIAPRSVYVCGGSVTTAGLTVSFSKDSESGTSLEAGALVIADKGCCCIDEFDKMTVQQHASLLEAMEQQSISIAKAGMVCNLSARTSIIAAANPSTGHYNKSKTVAENLKMSAPLLSRFDLVYIMLDRPNEAMDSKLSRHVLALHTDQYDRKSASYSRQMDTKSFSSMTRDPGSSFQERLSYGHKEVCDPIPQQLMRKYIAYAKKYVHPKLSPEAANILQEFYLSLRKRRHCMDGTPITTRQLESMVRLTEAKARSELREIASEQDARDVKELMLESMMGVYSDELGILNFSRSSAGSGMSKASATKKLVSILQLKAERSGSSIFTYMDIKELATTANIKPQDIDQIINTLNEQGFILKRGPKLFKLLTAGF